MCGILMTQREFCLAISVSESFVCALDFLRVTNQGMLLSRRKFQRSIIEAFHKISKAGNVDFIFDSLK
jgi:hypothetical protein